MRITTTILAAFTAATLVTPATAQAVRSQVHASNGILVDVYADEFAGRYEYSAPTIDFADGFALVAAVVRPGKDGEVGLQGSFSYRGDWRYYSSALFRGGDPVTYIEGSRDVGSCSGSRYGGGCRLSEGFFIEFTPEEVEKHAQNGTLDIQVRAQRAGATAMISVPVTYIEAVREVSTQRGPKADASD